MSFFFESAHGKAETPKTKKTETLSRVGKKFDFFPFALGGDLRFRKRCPSEITKLLAIRGSECF
jgi:hypothetical protein